MKFYEHLGKRKAWLKAIDQRLYEISDELSDLEQEKKHLEWMRERLSPCDDCKGYGQIRIIEDQDSSYMKTCKKCKGSGIRPIIHNPKYSD